MKVALMAGHGGRDKGAVALDGMLLEKHANLETAQHVYQQLVGVPWVEPFLLRTWDEYLSRKEMRSRAAKYSVDLVVEIHHDSLPTNTKAHGLCAYYGKSKPLVKNSAVWTVAHAPLPLRGGRVVCAYDDPDRDDDDWKVRPQTVVECYRTDTLLVECGFLSNTKDHAFLKQPHARDLVANTIVVGIIRYAQLKQGVS